MSPAAQILMHVPLFTFCRDAKTKAGVEFLVGFETEFILLKSTNPVVAVNNHSWTASNGLPSGSVESRVLREIAESLEKSGIELTMYHAEAAPGQVNTVRSNVLPSTHSSSMKL